MPGYQVKLRKSIEELNKIIEAHKGNGARLSSSEKLIKLPFDLCNAGAAGLLFHGILRDTPLDYLKNVSLEYSVGSDQTVRPFNSKSVVADSRLTRAASVTLRVTSDARDERALAVIAKHANPKNLATRIFYEGNIGHQENRTFVNLLDIKMEHLTPEALAKCNYLALVDSPAPGANNDLPQGTKIHIIIDHHRDEKHPASAGTFADIRPGVGATASILTQYLQELDIPVDKRVATALMYGIRADTKDFKRNTTPQDLNYAGFLLPLTDADLLDKIMSPSLSQETIDVLGKAIQNKQVISGYLFSNVGYVMNRDALPQAADLLITLEGVNTALVYGITDTAIVVSARNRDIRLHVGNALAEAFGDIGDAGGHPNLAAATLPLHYFGRVEQKAELLNITIDPILQKFKTLVGLENEGK